MVIFERNDIQGLITALHARGYSVIGPTVRDGYITFDAIDSVDAVAAGMDRCAGGGLLPDRASEG